MIKFHNECNYKRRAGRKYVCPLGAQHLSGCPYNVSYCFVFLTNCETLKKSHFNLFLFLSPVPTRNPVYCLTLNLHLTYFAIELTSKNGEVSNLYPPNTSAQDKILTQCVFPCEFQVTLGIPWSVIKRYFSPELCESFIGCRNKQVWVKREKTDSTVS